MNTNNQDATPEEVGTIKKPSGKPSSTLKKFALWLLFSLALVIIIVSVILAWGLGTQAGREWAAKTAITIANTSDNVNVKAINIESPSLGLWTIDSIELYLADKKTFTAQKFEFRWFPKELFDQKIHIEAMLAEKMDVYLYESEEKPKVEKESQPFTIPSLPYIEFENFNFPSINIHKEQTSNEVLSTDTTHKSSQDALIQSLEKITLSGNFLLPENQLLQLNLNAESSAKNPLKINIKSTVSHNEKQQAQVNIVGSLSEGAGGNLGSLIKIADNKSLYAQIDAGINATITPQGPNTVIDLKELHIDLLTPKQAKKSHKVQLQTLAEINTENLTAVVNTFTLDIGNTTHTGYGSWDGSEVQASLTLNKLPLEMVSIWFKPIDSGAITGEFLAKGTVTEGELKNLQWSVNSELNTRYQKVPVFTKIIAQGNQDLFKINTLNIKSNKATIAASGAVDIHGNANAIVFSIENLGTNLIKTLELPLPPSVPLDKADLTIHKASGKVSGKLLDPNIDATIHIKGKYENQPIEGESIIKKKGDAIVIEKLWLTSNDAKSSVSGNINLKSLAADVSLSINEFPIHLLALGGVPLPDTLSAKVSSDLAFKGYLSPKKITQADIDGNFFVNGVFDNIPFSVNANGSQTEALATLHNLNVSTFDQSVLNINGEFFNDIFDVSFIANKLPLKLLEALDMPLVNGEFTANIQAQGNINKLKETGNISGALSYTTEFTGIDENDEEKAYKYTWASNIETLNQSKKSFPNSSKQLNIASTITRENKNSGDINVTVPLDTYLEYIIEKKKTLPSLAVIEGQFDLTTLGFFLDPDLHQFSGKAETQLSITGQASSPKLTGFFTINDGSYLNAITRSGMKEIECRLDAKKASTPISNIKKFAQQSLLFRIETCTAKDSDSGLLALKGSIVLPVSIETGSIDLSLKVEKMNIIQRADIQSQLSGEVTLIGDFEDVWARGELDISPLTATIDGNFGGNIPSIEIIDIEELNNVQPETEIEDKGIVSIPIVNLDLKIVADQKAYVRGRGLEAELYGEMGIQGVLSKPKLTGEFNVRRGQFDIFNKVFDLEKGEVSFANEAIALDIEGVYTKGGEEIRAKLIGPSDQVDIKLSSIPKKPDDEILALLIFGKSVASITPFEAVRLAMAVQTLRGGSSAFDPIGSTRDLLGVDTITIDGQDADGNEGVNLGVGKYLNEKVYLELQRTPDPSQPWKGNLEIELAPKINLESSAGGSTGIEGAEVTWKHDY